jgi:hypothetical protein
MTITVNSSASVGGSSNSSSSSGSSTSKVPDHTMKAHGRVELQLLPFVASARLLSPSPSSPEQDAGCRGVAGEVGGGRWCGSLGRHSSRCGKMNTLYSKI